MEHNNLDRLLAASSYAGVYGEALIHHSRCPSPERPMFLECMLIAKFVLATLA